MNKTTEQIIQEAEKLFKEKKYQDIIMILSDVLLIDRKDATLYIWRARSYDAIGDIESDLTVTQESIQNDSLVTVANGEGGNIWHNKEGYDKAIVDYTEAIRISPTFALAYHKRGLTWASKAGHDEAIIDFTEAIQLDTNNKTIYNDRGNAWYNKGEYDKAIVDYTEAIRIDKAFTNAYFNRADAWANKNEYDQAITDYTEAIRLNQNHTDAYNNRGLTWNKKKEYDKAITDYTEVIRIDEDNLDAYYNRADAWAEKKEYDKAIIDYTEAIRINPIYTIGYNSRGIAWYYKKEYDKAIIDYTEAIRIDQLYGHPYFNRGLAWFNKKEYDKAISDYTEAIRIGSTSARAYYSRGNAWHKKNEYEKAIADYESYIQLTSDPNDYYKQIAVAKIAEIKKKIDDVWYDEFANIVNKIKSLLLFDSPSLTHYTSLTGAREMILNKSLFRLSEGAFLNDTSEGRELFNYLSYETTKRTTDDTMAELFVERPFIGSFVADNKHNDLTLWRMYGKEAQAEAKGCALTIYKTKFIDSLKQKVSPTDTKIEIQSQIEEQFTFYNVAYLSKTNFIIPGKSNETESQLNALMNALKNKVDESNKNQKISVNKLLNEIAYLFKSSEYQYENEVRLVVQGTGFTKSIEKKDTPPKVYIELVDIVPALSKITLGPKVDRADEWAAAFNYYIKSQLIDREEGVEIIISHLPFK